MSDEEKRWPFDGFYLKLAEAHNGSMSRSSTLTLPR